MIKKLSTLLNGVILRVATGTHHDLVSAFFVFSGTRTAVRIFLNHHFLTRASFRSILLIRLTFKADSCFLCLSLVSLDPVCYQGHDFLIFQVLIRRCCCFDKLLHVLTVNQKVVIIVTKGDVGVWGRHFLRKCPLITVFR